MTSFVTSVRVSTAEVSSLPSSAATYHASDISANTAGVSLTPSLAGSSTSPSLRRVPTAPAPWTPSGGRQLVGEWDDLLLVMMVLSRDHGDHMTRHVTSAHVTLKRTMMIRRSGCSYLGWFLLSGIWSLPTCVLLIWSSCLLCYVMLCSVIRTGIISVFSLFYLNKNFIWKISKCETCFYTFI